MQVRGKTVVVTGGASGIGLALCRRFHRDGAAHVVIADRDEAAGIKAASDIGCDAITCDVAVERQVIELVDKTEQLYGPVALFCSNAGVAVFDANPGDATSASNEAWERSWAVNVMAHVYAARTLLPRMAPRGQGYFLHTVSAAGLLSQIGGALYAATKHAAIGFAENLAIMHRDQGIRVSVLCPQGVDTPMLRSLPEGPQQRDGVLSAEAVADSVIEGLASERFLILPHVEVAEYLRRKATDYDRWIASMARLRRALYGEATTTTSHEEKRP